MHNCFKKIKSNIVVVLFFLIIWSFLLIRHIFFKPYVNENIIFSIAFVIHLFMIPLAFKIYMKMEFPDKKIFKWFCISAIGLFLNDLFFYFGIIIPYGPLIQLPAITIIVDFLVYLIWLFAISIFLSKLAINHILHLQRFIKIFLLFIIANAIVISLFSSSIPYAFNILSWQAISQIFSFVMEFIIFDLIILSLIHTENRGIAWFFVGLTFLISGDFFINYSFVSQTQILFSYGQLLWVLGLFFMLYGLWVIKQDKNYLLRIWFRKSSNIKSRLAFWTFGVSIISFIAFFIVAFSFSLIDRSAFAGLPFFIMIYSIFVVILSLFTGKNFERPFKKIANNIEALMLNNDKSNLDSHFSIEEFIFLQKFITDVYDLKEERDRAKKRLGEITAQVAHDIRSPLTAIEVLVKRFNNYLPETERVMLRNAARRIDDIAYQLVQKYKGQVIQEGNDNLIFLYLAALEITSEKRIEHSNKNINIEVLVKDPKTFFAVTRGNITECKRLLSNLINNSINALKNGGNIEISLSASSGYCTIKIIDNGCGIAKDILEKLQSENIENNNAIGLGLTHARKYLKTINGTLQIESELGKGTEVILQMPLCNKPEWLSNEIMFREDCILVIVDDDPSIHDAWRQKIRQEIEEKHHKKINIIHLNSPEECLAWIESYPENNVVLFADYEYLNSNMNGLQLLKSISKPIMHKKLVTSHYENEEITNDLSDGIKLLPKQLVHAIEFNLLPVTDGYDYNLVFIDDQEFNTEMWENLARMKGIKIKTYHSTDDFQRDKANIPFITPIYVDQDLGEGKETGVEFTRKLREEGFQNLYLATSYIVDTDYEWLKGVTSKKPPFI